MGKGEGGWAVANCCERLFHRCLSGYDTELQLGLLLLCCWHGAGCRVPGPGETVQGWAVPPPAALPRGERGRGPAGLTG